jgi:hypothetical protein
MEECKDQIFSVDGTRGVKLSVTGWTLSVTGWTVSHQTALSVTEQPQWEPKHMKYFLSFSPNTLGLKKNNNNVRFRLHLS